ncbi:PHP domain-containing protein [Acetobacterium fimetarium]|uniref:PHP domain-containing protein n=1 Tax=Acetobacterium fimetarium TaxID=52691 RepID=A0ABR6WXD9_9FIRM|nr:PHP domain-containing protein [Acetobacterium fimetarium]MBC3805257.1 PHP domain-containing protein [Acetobacterium fimetarium]
MGKLDLHVHTRASGDGELSGEEIIRLAVKENVTTLAITDHDSIEEVKNAVAWGERLNVEVIPGSEVFCRNKDKLVHMLAYYIDLDNSPIARMIDNIHGDRKRWLKAQIELLEEKGFYIDQKYVYEFCKDNPPLPSAVSYAIFKDERNNSNPLVREYKEKCENPVHEFVLRLLFYGKPFFSPNYIPETKAFIDAVHQSGGVPILAHPGYKQMEVDFDNTAFIDDLVAQGISGVEAYYTTHTEEETAKYLAYCQRHQLIVTAGSDFHGKFKPSISLGQLKTTDYKIVEDLKKERDKIRHI